MTHTPPKDKCDINSSTNSNAGCRYLAEAVYRIQPKIHVFGHIHEAHGWTIDGPTTYINAAICSRKYLPVYKPIVFDLPRRV